MIWGAPNSGFYATVGPGQVNCQPRLVVHPQNVAASPDPFEGNLRLADRVMRCRAMVVGVPRPGHMVEFRASFARNFAGPMVEVGFIQNLLSSTRTAEYGAPAPRLKFWRDGAAIGGGLLDCGTNAPPWYQGRTARLVPAAPGQSAGVPAMVECDDNPLWTVPMTLETPELPNQRLPLVRVVLQNRFRLFAVARVNGAFIPICRTEWATDIVWHHQTGLRVQVTKDPSWVAPSPTDGLITTGPTASQLLVDRIGRV